MSRPSESVIAAHPPADGREWDCQCARCGSSVTTEECEACGGEGHGEPGELYEEDPLWYGQDDICVCFTCLGRGFWRHCLSSPEWCEAHPRPGRETVERGTVEWFTFDAEPEGRR